jgi:diaminopimelate decarboxylase
LTNDYYPVLAKELFELAVEVVQMTDVDLDFINLSGGIGVNYKPDEVENDIAKIGDGVRQAYEAVLTPNGLGNVKIFTELGRFMLALTATSSPRSSIKNKLTVITWVSMRVLSIF